MSDGQSAGGSADTEMVKLSENIQNLKWEFESHLSQLDIGIAGGNHSTGYNALRALERYVTGRLDEMSQNKPLYHLQVSKGGNVSVYNEAWPTSAWIVIFLLTALLVISMIVIVFQTKIRDQRRPYTNAHPTVLQVTGDPGQPTSVNLI